MTIFTHATSLKNRAMTRAGVVYCWPIGGRLRNTMTNKILPFWKPHWQRITFTFSSQDFQLVGRKKSTYSLLRNLHTICMAARISCDDCTATMILLTAALSGLVEMNDEWRLKSIYGCNIILRVCNETHHESLLAPGQCQRASQTPSTSPRHYRCQSRS